MKKYVATLIVFLFCGCVTIPRLLGQAPAAMTYQAEVRDDKGGIIKETDFELTIGIHEGAIGLIPTLIYHYPVTTDKYGLFTVTIGDPTDPTDPLYSLDWEAEPHYLEVQVTDDKNITYDLGTSQFLSVPYALHARTAETAINLDINSDQSLSGNITFTNDILVNGLTVGKGQGNVQYNTAIGDGALNLNSSGNWNTATGSLALYNNSSGIWNTANGIEALYNNETGNFNTAIGEVALYNNKDGSRNTAVGGHALHSNIGGHSNTAIGVDAGRLNTGNGSVFLGFEAGLHETGDNKLYIDNQNRGTEIDGRIKSLIYGVFNSNPDNQILTINGNVGIGTSAPNYNLDVFGDINFTGELLQNGNPYTNNDADADPTNELQNLTSILTQSNDGGAIQIKNIANPTEPQDAATKAYVDALELRLSELEEIIFTGTTPNITDIDGNVYETVRIGFQYWMAKNLATTKYNNGDPIGTTNPATLHIWDEDTPKYQWAYDGDESNVATYGRLYTWYAVVDERKICPAGWRVPNVEDWNTLINFLEGEDVAGSQLKEIGTDHWESPNTGATNSTGFTARPGGQRYDSLGSPMFFTGLGTSGRWWSSTPGVETWEGPTMAYMANSSTFCNLANQSPVVANSVRCVRD